MRCLSFCFLVLFFPAFGTLALSANKFRVILVPVIVVAAVFCVLGTAGFSLWRLVVLMRVVVFQRRLALACAAVVKALLAAGADATMTNALGQTANDGAFDAAVKDALASAGHTDDVDYGALLGADDDDEEAQPEDD